MAWASTLHNKHRKLTMLNIFISDNNKIKVTDYCLHNMSSNVSLLDGQLIDIFNLGICLLKLLGLATIDEQFDYYTHDKRALRDRYKNVGYS